MSGLRAPIDKVPNRADVLADDSGVRSTYAGPVEVGEDLLTIIIGDRVDVRRFTAPVR